ncbi:MAG: asparagine synthase-related protein [Anaerolineae bacterium]|nr:asparagine synthase-related protein [Anaerolineae bacterium]MDW8067596.1 asparagine synthase-related protein [Anaerolineae bacterium]
MDDLLQSLRSVLQDAVRRHPAEVLFFSGGLDTSILAVLTPSIPLLHICLEDGGEDLRYAEAVARHLNRDLTVRRVSIEEALSALPEVVRIRRTFDPALPNDLALYFAFAEARSLGFGSAMTGDGADEGFAGYPYMWDLDLASYIPWLVQRMRFSADEFGEWFGMEVRQPYRDPVVVDRALSIPPELKVREEKGTRFGKWILRKAFEDDLPPHLCWQGKRPIEVGSGFSRLRERVMAMLTDEDWAAPVRFFTCDQPYYYRLYCQMVGAIPPPAPGERACPACGAGMPQDARHCRVCGYS